ncbi:MAG: outer membrane beta-barrel protein [Alphaproteobacteria bacterium]|nr:outer membrane beta-barrel protein [Alphaproteobacteria bacterium]
MKKFLFVTVASLLCAFTAKAAELSVKPIVGLDYVYSRAEYKGDNKKALQKNFNSPALVIGTQINKFFSVEGLYQQTFNESKSHAGLKTKSKYRVLGLDAIGHLPLGCSQKFELLGLVGTGNYRYSAKNAVEKGSDDGWYGRIGGGLQYNVTSDVAVRAMVKNSWVDVKGLDSVLDATLGVRYSF